MRIWDIHVHFPRNFQQPDADPQFAVDHLAERLHSANVVKASLLCSSFWTTHEESIAMAMKHEDLFVPHAAVDPEDTTYERIHELRSLGYRGLKITSTRREYDCRDYFPVYRAAEELDMPILFHCGVLGGGIDWLAKHPRRFPEAAWRLQEMEAATERLRKELAEAERTGQPQPALPRGMTPARFRGPRDISAVRMSPFHLETIANSFPRLKIIGAHLGGTGSYDESASVARWRRWVYFDVSGGEVIERHAVERGLIGRDIAVEKLIFGSDCPADEVQDHIQRFVRIFDELGLSEEEKDLIWYRNAAELYGLETPAWAERQYD